MSTGAAAGSRHRNLVDIQLLGGLKKKKSLRATIDDAGAAVMTGALLLFAAAMLSGEKPGHAPSVLIVGALNVKRRAAPD